ncbi:MAG: SDR family NAD(P)-dependent oxidoreductase [Gammaproteobacteria bacterium]|nr:SDR family NAD(P)-dependent oxidoreductase [Gammaproteobacteria bacterium]
MALPAGMPGAELLTAAASAVAGGQQSQSPTVLITGANRGLGLEFVQQYAARGWNVIAAVRDPEGATQLEALAAAQPAIAIEQMDVTDHASVDALAARLAGRPIDVLINTPACSAIPATSCSGASGTPSSMRSFAPTRLAR